MNIYQKLGAMRVINAAGPQTRLGGSLMPPEVLAAMMEAAQASVDMVELQGAASKVIAKATGAEAGIVTCGAAAGLTLAASACLTGLDAAKMDRLPDTTGMANEIVIARMHRTAYDHALRASGAKLVEVGFNDRSVGCGVRGVEPWEIEDAIGPSTVAIAYTASWQASGLSLPDAVRVADAHGLPVIVDAAAQLPPVDNLKRFIGEGASLVVFSGGKAIQGPQASGLLCGKRDLVAAALLQQIDMDIGPNALSSGAGLLPLDKLKGLPHHGIGRGFKTGKEEIVGLLTALRRFTGPALEKELTTRLDRLNDIHKRLEKVADLKVAIVTPPGGASPFLELRLAVERAKSLVAELRSGEPRIELATARVEEGVLVVKADALREDEPAIIADRVRLALSV